MFLLESAIEVLKGNLIYARVMGDYLMDNCEGKPGVDVYIRRLTNNNPKKLRMQTVIDTVINYGSKIERKIMSKMYRRVLRAQYPRSKKVFLAHLKKPWSLQKTWHSRTLIIQLLELGFKARCSGLKAASE